MMLMFQVRLETGRHNTSVCNVVRVTVCFPGVKANRIIHMHEKTNMHVFTYFIKEKINFSNKQSKVNLRCSKLYELCRMYVFSIQVSDHHDSRSCLVPLVVMESYCSFTHHLC